MARNESDFVVQVTTFVVDRTYQTKLFDVFFKVFAVKQVAGLAVVSCNRKHTTLYQLSTQVLLVFVEVEITLLYNLFWLLDCPNWKPI